MPDEYWAIGFENMYTSDLQTNSLGLNKADPTVMLVDLNSCFASVEQQANPLIRGKPVAVAAYTTPSGCILAASYEAKALGVQTGMRVHDGKKLCPRLIVLPSDPPKYREVHARIADVLSVYTHEYAPKSIDEYVLRLDGYPVISKNSVQQVGKQIKKRIKKEVGDNLTVSIGVGTSYFTAKVASNLRKPDGLETINHQNILDVYRQLSLVDLHGINIRYGKRLNLAGIYSPIEFYQADLDKLKSVFKSVSAFYWYTRLRGWDVDDVEFGRRSFGNSYALPHSDGKRESLLPTLQRLVEKTGSRMRKAGYQAHGIHLSLAFRDHGFWHKSKRLPHSIYDSKDIYQYMKKLLFACPQYKPVRILAESCFALTKSEIVQFKLFENVSVQKSLVRSIDMVNEKWGDFTVTPTRMLEAKKKVLDRIAFGQAGVEGAV
ncbi:hypothetical protein ACFL2C_04110 [Patescibacteria group bacterium]